MWGSDPIPEVVIITVVQFLALFVVYPRQGGLLSLRQAGSCLKKAQGDD